MTFTIPEFWCGFGCGVLSLLALLLILGGIMSYRNSGPKGVR